MPFAGTRASSIEVIDRLAIGRWTEGYSDAQGARLSIQSETMSMPSA
jgi:hypothetical protein